MTIRKHTAAEWKVLNLTLRAGEIGIERDTKKHKVGDGLTPWNEMSYQFSKVIADALYASVESGAAKPLPTLQPLVSTLAARQSAALSFFGDSTGDSDATVEANDRLTSRFARRLAAEYPSHHVLFKGWDGAGGKFKPWTVLQNHAQGRRYFQTTLRSLRYVPEATANSIFTSGNMDLRVLVAPDLWVTAADQTLITRVKGDGLAWGTAFQFGWVIKPDGKLAIKWSTNGSTWSSEKVSTVVVPTANATAVWLRATVEIVPATGWNVKFYTSSANDGVTWTQLGTTVTFAGATSALFNPDTKAFFEVGATGWQPTNSPVVGKLYEVELRDGVDGPTIAPSALERWERYGDSNIKVLGAPTLYILNASQSGTDTEDHMVAGRVAKETPDYGQQAIIINNGHNEAAASGSTFLPAFGAWVDAIKTRLPYSGMNVVGQNPHTADWPNEATYGREHITRIMQLMVEAQRRGWGFINVYQAYLDDPRGLAALISSDGLHPTQAGYLLSGDTVAKAAGIN